MEPQHIFHRLPVELVVKIYKSMDDAGDVKATLSTCRRAKAIFDDNAGVIAKSHLLRRLHPSNIKLMVMAVASRDVDPQDEESIERFYRPPGRNSQTLRQTPHVEWVDKYWDVFSHVELEAVLWTRLPFNLCFSDGMNSGDCRIYQHGLRPNGYLGYAIGLESLHNIDQFRRVHYKEDRICNLCLSHRDNWFCEWQGRQFESPLHDARRCLMKKTDLQPRFQPDPDGVDEETWQKLLDHKLADYFRSRRFGQPPWMACWDSATLTRWGEQLNLDL